MGKEAGCMSMMYFEPNVKAGGGVAHGWKKSTAVADGKAAAAGDEEQSAGCFDCVMRRRVHLDTEIDAERDEKLEAYLVKRTSAAGDAVNAVEAASAEIATLAPASPLPSWRDDAGVVISESSGGDGAESRNSDVSSAISRKASREAHEIGACASDVDAEEGGGDEQSKRARTVHFNCSSTDIDTQTQLPIVEGGDANDGGADADADDDDEVVIAIGGDGSPPQAQFRSSSSTSGGSITIRAEFVFAR